MPSQMPTLYIPHGGGPCFFMEWSPPDTWTNMRHFLENMVQDLPARPKAILVVSAHWEAAKPSVTGQKNPPLLYDYSGFPPHTYELTWPAPGSPELAQNVQSLLKDAGIDSTTDHQRGFDHGVFIPLKLALPEADIPTVALSLQSGLDPQTHFNIGTALAPLRKQGVLIIGSGLSYHNVGALMGRVPPKGAAAFDVWLTETMAAEPSARNAALMHWQNAPDARLAHPREEHLTPIFITAGAAADEPAKKIYADVVNGAAVSGFRFG